jgi:integrase
LVVLRVRTFPGHDLFGGHPVVTEHKTGGAMAQAIKLTKRAADAARPAAARYELWDADLKGFGLRVEPSGVKTFIVRYRPGGGRMAPKRFMSIGRLGTVTPDQARQNAKKLLGAAASGKDPAADKKRQRGVLTVGVLAERFLAEHVEPKRKPSTAALYRHALRGYLVPVLGRRGANDVARADVARLHHKLRGKPFLANRVLAVAGSMFSWAAEHGLCAEGHNPTTRVERYPEDRRERFLSSDELERLGRALREAETTGLPWGPDSSNPKAKHAPKEKNRRVVIGREATAAIRLLLFTGGRLREILHLRWEHYDAERGLLLLPDSKTGRKTIILNAPAVSVLAGLPRKSPFVIPGEPRDGEGKSAGPKPRADLKRPWAAIAKRAKLDGVRLHDLRHTHASFGAGAGLGLPILGKLLGHTQASTTQRYSHLADDPLRRASERIGGTIAAALEGKKAAGVAPMKGQAREL